VRIAVQGKPGELAARPEDALEALAKAAEADGADLDDWLEKAMVKAGATNRSIPVSRDPAYQVVKDATVEALRVYRTAMTLQREAIRECLERAIRDADIARYNALLRE